MLRTTITLLLACTAVMASPISTAIRQEAEFSYDPSSENGPANWGDLDGYETCGTGESQSPIDLPAMATLKTICQGPAPSFGTTELKYVETHENWALQCEDESSCGSTDFNGETYNLVNLHFHSPSEHKLNGEQFPLEAHMVHKSASGKLLVIATMFRYPSYLAQLKHEDLTTDNELLGSILEYVEEEDEEGEEEEALDVDLSQLIGDMGYVQYDGSLTTPPCTEGVTWLIAQTLQRVSREQVEAFRESAEVQDYGINRPTQDLNGRELTAFVRRI